MIKYTSWELTIDPHHECYVLSIDWEEDGHICGQKGARIFFVSGGYYVWMAWGKPIPIAVFTSKEEMIHKFVELYGNNYKVPK
jgi:hypothetical protein